MFALVVTLISSVHAYGPIMHAVMSCEALSTSSLHDCMASRSTADFVMNAAIDLPDALAFGKFKMDAPSSYLCSDLSYAHDPAFGAFMLGNTLAADDNTTAVAWGFLAHTLGDMIGFWRQSGDPAGLLCAKHVGPCSGDILYINLWHLMTDIDALLVQLNAFDTKRMPTVAKLTQAQLQFVADQSVLYNALDPKFAPLSVAAMQQCIEFWQGTQQLDLDLSALKSSRAQVPALLAELEFFTALNATAVTHAVQRQVKCGNQLISSVYLDVAANVSIPQIVANAQSTAHFLYTQVGCL
jgi:hypothetical protein